MYISLNIRCIYRTRPSLIMSCYFLLMLITVMLCLTSLPSCLAGSTISTTPTTSTTSTTTFVNVIPSSDADYAVVNTTYGAHMFWWFYGAQGVEDRTKVPLVVWLQGGPGASSWIGDLVEFGPLDVDLKPRKFSWVHGANLLFFDNPVGTGFSYVDNPDGYVRTEHLVAEELVKGIKAFLHKHPIFSSEKIPFWIFAESYGPKYASHFAVRLHEEIQKGHIELNFQGVSLGDGWISPMDCVHKYAEYWHSLSLVNSKEKKDIEAVAKEVKYLYDQGKLHEAGNYVDDWVQGPFLGGFWSNIENVLGPVPTNTFEKFGALLAKGGEVRDRYKHLIPDNVTFGGQSGQVSNDLAVDFLKPAVNEVEILLNAGYTVVIYTGQLDGVVPTICTEEWLQSMNWDGLEGFNETPKFVHKLNNFPSGYSQKYLNLQFWTILRAGHMVPLDASEMAWVMFQSIISGE